ncbi:hypothetical protein QBC35DRAFT_349618, partial [Podospora australis]
DEGEARNPYSSGRNSPLRDRLHIHSRTSSDDTNDSSSHHGDDDVFSDRGRSDSRISSVGSVDDTAKTPQGTDSISRRESYSCSQLSDGARIVSGTSFISGLSQYDEKDAEFVPTTRESRNFFRSPSEVRAMQLNSPTSSVFEGNSLRPSSKRSAKGFPVISRVGSPSTSAQYSPKGRTTPTRFKTQKEAPLVLLHVTLLPLRWVWGETLNGLDTINGKAIDGGGATFEASDQIKTLRDAWRELQDRVGDTVLERGILLPHPQSDFEVLEERLLEALELPVRRRARILECGHYLGPATVPLEEETDNHSDDGGYSSSGRSSSTALTRSEQHDPKHWCNVCRNEIKYQALGPHKVFRVKVFASNGLMKAGAWEACWREMERVDVEVEPVVDLALQQELEKVAVILLEQEEQRLIREASAAVEAMEQSQAQLLEATDGTQVLDQVEFASTSSRPSSSMQITMRAPSPQPEPPTTVVRVASPELLHPPDPHTIPRPRSRQQNEPIDMSEERRRRDEERLREIYGDSPADADAALSPESDAATLVEPQHPPTSYEGQSQALTTITPASSLHPDPASPRHPDSYIPPPSPQSPSEVIVERREAAARSHKTKPKRSFDAENAGFVDLLTEAFRVALDNFLDAARDSFSTIKEFFSDGRNVAICVLVLLLVVMGLGGRTGHQDMAPAVYRPEPKPEAHEYGKVERARLPEHGQGLGSVDVTGGMAGAGVGVGVDAGTGMMGYGVAKEAPPVVSPSEGASGVDVVANKKAPEAVPAVVEEAVEGKRVPQIEAAGAEVEEGEIPVV